MNEATFKSQIDALYSGNGSHKNAVQRECYSKNGFMKIAGYLMDNERIEAVAPIADNPIGWAKTKTSIMQNWYIILTNKRMIFASPTLILKELTATSFSYSSLTSVAAGKWNSIKMTAQGYVGFISVVGTYLYYDQRDELIRIIQQHMYS